VKVEVEAFTVRQTHPGEIEPDLPWWKPAKSSTAETSGASGAGYWQNQRPAQQETLSDYLYFHRLTARHH
jgi:hypothetical protein